MNKAVNAFVTCEQFKSFLSVNFKDFEELLGFSAIRALEDGENYITTIIRIRADIKLKDKSRQRISFILKIPLKLSENNKVNDKGESQSEVEAPTDYHELFVSEADMYDNIVPELEQIYAKFGIQLHFKAKRYRFAHELSCNYILMEDLQARGFENMPRQKGLDVAHTNAVLSKLAQWHAASAKRVEVSGVYPEEYVNSYFTDEHMTFIDSMNTTFNEPFKQCLESYNLLTREKEIIINYMRNMNQLYSKFGTVHPENFNVLNHGDFWINNIMFRHDDDDRTAVEEVIFVDFQLPKFGSFAMDLFCFLMTSPHWNIKLKSFDNFVGYYYLELVRNLKILQYSKSIPTLEDLKAQLEKHGLWGKVYTSVYTFANFFTYEQ
uniref:CHK kinase-like domain-containing protein n=1 Tax=Ceratitis capitata TaxID=7213 RepID=W8BQS7_CERCA